MGLGDFFKKAWDVTKTVVITTYEVTKEAIRDGVEKVREKLKEKPKNDARVDGYPSGYGLNVSGEDEKKALLEAREDAVIEYQKEIRKKSEERESQVKEAYTEAYAGVIEILKNNDVDILGIEHYMEERKKEFSNIMRDEINTKVSTGYSDWKRIVKQEPESRSDVKRIKKEMDEYTKKVYDTAENHLLDKLSAAFDSTNNHIQKSINKCLSDRRDALKMMKQSLVDLTQDKESQDKRLLKIAQESALMQFVNYETAKDI